MRTFRTKAIVLRRTNYGEADRIVQFLTPDGRRSVMARGVRKEKSKLAGGIELFAISDVVIGEGKGELGVVTSAKLEHFFKHSLDVLTIPLPLIQTWFYVRYASLLGHEFNLELDIDGAKLEADETYRYDSAEQGLRAVKNGEITGDHIKLLRLIASRPLKVLVQVGGVDGLLGTCLHVVQEHAAIDMR